MMRPAMLPLPAPTSAPPSTFRRARRNTREHWRGVAGLIAYMPSSTAPLLQNANAPERGALFAKEPEKRFVVAPPHGNA